MEKTNGLQNYLKQIREYPLLSAEEEKELAIKSLAGDEKAKNKLISCNLRLVVSIVKHYNQNTSLSFEDLIQEGNFGLFRATKDFNPELGWRFSTYATYWIKQSISRAILNHSRTIRIPIHIAELKGKYKKAQNELREQLGREATTKEIAKYLKVDLKKIEEIENLIKEPISLNESLNDEDDGIVEDLVADTSLEDPDDKLDNEFLAQALNKMLFTLDDKEQEVIALRFGLNQNKPKTLDEIGIMYGVTKERIRQIEQKALRKLRNPARANVLKVYLA